MLTASTLLRIIPNTCLGAGTVGLPTAAAAAAKIRISRRSRRSVVLATSRDHDVAGCNDQTKRVNAPVRHPPPVRCCCCCKDLSVDRRPLVCVRVCTCAFVCVCLYAHLIHTVTVKSSCTPKIRVGVYRRCPVAPKHARPPHRAQGPP